MAILYNKTIHYKENLALVSLFGLTVLSGALLTLPSALADVVDTITITVPTSCSISSTGENSHTAEIANGQHDSAIGETTIKAFCNDNEGFAIYAIGYTDNQLGKNVLTNSTLGSTHDIVTGTAITGNTSNWAMKLSTITSPTPQYPIIIAGSTDDTLKQTGDADFSNFTNVPDDYKKVAYRTASTDINPEGSNTAEGSTLKTTYQAYISPTQAAGEYTGQVKYTMIHPHLAVAGKLNIKYDGNGLTFANGKPTNLVTYNATSSETVAEVTKKSFKGAYNEAGEFNSYGVPAGNEVVTIDGAESIHIAVTYGAPQNNGGPPSDLYIFAGNHPDYTNSDSANALASCGSTNSVNGAFSSTGSSGSQVTMECDIASDSVTFYDYSANTSNTASMGYYAVITGQGTITSYNKTATVGTYSAPTTRSGQDVFLGWSTNPNANADAEEAMYADEAAVINNAPYLNDDTNVTLYAVWGKTLNAAYADAGKSQLSGYYKMQDGTNSICKEVYVGATGTLVDSRDNTTYTVGRLKDGNCWMLDNLALDPTDATTAQNMNETNTNATATAINNLLHGGSTTTGWSNVAVENKTSGWNTTSPNNAYEYPYINNASKNTTVTSYGAGNGKVGVYYNYCAASASTYCYASGQGVDVPDTIIDAPQDICPAGWRMPTGGPTGEYLAVAQKYSSTATETDSLQYNFSTPLSGYFYSSSAFNQGSSGFWWSSTYYDSSSMYDLNDSPTNVYPSSVSSSYRLNGRSMRCLVGE